MTADLIEATDIEINLLIVDDEAPLRKHLKKLLTMKNLQEELGRAIYIDEAPDADTADALIERHYDIVLIDMSMPNSKGDPDKEVGIKLLQRIKERSPKSEVIAITGYGTDERAIAAIEMGAFYFLNKPFPNELLIALIKRIINMKHTERLAQIDGLTNLYNKAFFNTILENEVNKFPKKGEPKRRLVSALSIAIVDIDNFKRINDTYGHIEGDRTLKAVANALRSSSRRTDIVARWGGEEFTVILPGATTAPALNQAERIRKAVGNVSVPREDGNGEIRVTARVGVATYPSFFEDVEELLKRADEASYFARQNGGNTTCGYDSEGKIRKFSELVEKVEA